MKEIKQALNKSEKVRMSVSSEDENTLLTTALKAIADKKGENIVYLDLRNIDEAVANYFILCESRNPLQMQAICRHIEERVKEKCAESPFHIQRGEGWTLVDYVDVVIHIFREEERKFYDLDSLWLDGKRTEYTD